MSGSGQKNWQVQAEHSGSLIRLQNLIQRGSGSCLLILQQNRPLYRDGLIEFLGQEHSQVLNLKELGGFEAFEAELEKGVQGRILHLINLESLGEEKQRVFFKGLNYHREHIARTCSGILAFWLPEPLVREMALQAADFWAWREQVLDFSLPLKSMKRFSFDDLLNNLNCNISVKQNRIEEIQTFLSRSAQQPTLSTADLKRELGNLYKSIGKYGKAEQVFNEAIADYRNLDEACACTATRHNLAEVMTAQGKYEQALKIFKEQVLPANEYLGDVREQAVTMGKIADILQARGEPNKALNIRRNEELPVYERLGDIREKAVTMGKIADIIQNRGQLDEALEIRKQEELPVYERLGDVRSKAITMGKIAQIFQARGELDKALEIRQQEELPIFERLGDVQAKAVTMGWIADIFHARGELDKALEIRQQEELPIYSRLGNMRAKTITMGRIANILADILQARGKLDKALEIRQQEELPVYEQVGDVRSKAVTMGKIADILEARGQLDKALEIRQQEELPTFERLGDVRELLLCRAKIAVLLHEMNTEANKERIEELLLLALADAKRLKLPRETEWIEEVMKKLGIAAKKDGAE